MPINPSARFQVDSVCFNAPGVCFICKSGQNGPFIRTGLKHDFFKEAPDAARDGDIYICKSCLTEMAGTMVIASTDIDSLVEQARLAGVVEGVLLGKKALDEYAANFVDISLGFSFGLGGGNSIPATDVPEDSAGEQQDPESAVEGFEQGVLIGSKQGPDDVSGNRSDELPADFS